MGIIDYIVVGGVLILIALILLSIGLPRLDVLFGNIFDNWQNALMFLAGVVILIFVIARLK